MATTQSKLGCLALVLLAALVGTVAKLCTRMVMEFLHSIGV